MLVRSLSGSPRDPAPRCSPRRGGGLFAALALLLIATSAGGAAAQTVDAGEAEPADVEQRLEAPEAAPTTVEPIEAPEAEAAEPLADADRRFVLTAVVITGSTVYTPAALAPLYVDYLARPVGVAEIDRILAALTALYRADGYFLTRAIAPPQDLTGGVLRVHVVEGYVGRVTYTGDLPASEDRLAGYTDDILAARPLRLATLERHVLLINDIPGVRVKPITRPIPDEPGAYALTLRFAHDSLVVMAGLDNRGKRTVGRLQGFVVGDLNSVIGQLERLRLVFFTVPDDPEELQFGKIVLDQPIGSEGTTVTLDASYSGIDAGGALEIDEVEGESYGGGLELGHPFVRSRVHTLAASLRFDVKNSEQGDVDGALLDDRLRAARLGILWRVTDAVGGRTEIAIQGSRGLDILDASDEGDVGLSRTGGVVEFTKLAADISRRQKLWGGLYARLWASGQYSEDTLLSSEEFRIGGARFGRAYDSSELTASNGAAGALELGFRGRPGNRFFTGYELYGYYDGGVVWSDTGSGSSLVSTGGGLRITLFRSVQAGFEVGVPLTRPSGASGENDPRYFFKLRARF